MHVPVRRFPGHALLQRFSFAIPPPKVFYPLIKPWLKKGGFVARPFDGGETVLLAEWITPPVIHDFFSGVIESNPELKLLDESWHKVEQKPGCLVDVGAAVGSHVVWMRHRSDKPIIAFEPAPPTWACLQRTIKINCLEDVELKQLGCGASDGEITLELGANSAVATDQTTGPTSTVKVVRLDDVLPTTAFIKIDVEGMERGVLEGARRTIERDHPVLWIEGHPTAIGRFGHSIDELYEQLTKWGYKTSTQAIVDHKSEAVTWASLRASPPVQIHILAE